MAAAPTQSSEFCSDGGTHHWDFQFCARSVRPNRHRVVHCRTGIIISRPGNFPWRGKRDGNQLQLWQFGPLFTPASSPRPQRRRCRLA